jgi:hypothetical protein
MRQTQAARDLDVMSFSPPICDSEDRFAISASGKTTQPGLTCHPGDSGGPDPTVNPEILRCMVDFDNFMATHSIFRY